MLLLLRQHGDDDEVLIQGKVYLDLLSFFQNHFILIFLSFILLVLSFVEMLKMNQKIMDLKNLSLSYIN